jgi:hypothetical protein
MVRERLARVPMKKILVLNGRETFKRRKGSCLVFSSSSCICSDHGQVAEALGMDIMRKEENECGYNADERGWNVDTKRIGSVYKEDIIYRAHIGIYVRNGLYFQTCIAQREHNVVLLDKLGEFGCIGFEALRPVVGHGEGSDDLFCANGAVMIGDSEKGECQVFVFSFRTVAHPCA